MDGGRTLRNNVRLRRQAEVFKSLGHPGRMAILHALADGPVCACELAAAAGCSAPTASRHLQVLRQAGVIADERRGQQIFYRLVLGCALKFAMCIDREDAADPGAAKQILNAMESSAPSAIPNIQTSLSVL